MYLTLAVLCFIATGLFFATAGQVKRPGLAVTCAVACAFAFGGACLFIGLAGTP